MVSSSGNSMGSIQMNQISGWEGGDLEEMMKERKRKRMESNRESAKRSRMRKQKHMDDLIAQARQLRNENTHILKHINLATEHYLNVEAENSVLRAEVMELDHRLSSLTGMLSLSSSYGGILDFPSAEIVHGSGIDGFMTNHLWTCLLNQPIMASLDAMIQY
ncbi:unnamed protein product [Cuscuta epithymum]|uniref:BZIP domain-containing protein n=1 Tax=Cuscuta epithymum TaxID=186058 RepID=A0AAV0C7M2_9ASTE|nr:unnamed protein product [Cuscuta epithymum]